MLLLHSHHAEADAHHSARLRDANDALLPIASLQQDLQVDGSRTCNWLAAELSG